MSKITMEGLDIRTLDASASSVNQCIDIIQWLN